MVHRSARGFPRGTFWKSNRYNSSSAARAAASPEVVHEAAAALSKVLMLPPGAARELSGVLSFVPARSSGEVSASGNFSEYLPCPIVVFTCYMSHICSPCSCFPFAESSESESASMCE